MKRLADKPIIGGTDSRSVGSGKGSLSKAWFIVPVMINGVLQLLFQTVFGFFDGGVLQAIALYSSIPYWVAVVFIGVRRWRHPSIGDVLFLSFGQFVCILAMFRLLHFLFNR
jgi:hypothetical protein